MLHLFLELSSGDIYVGSTDDLRRRAIIARHHGITLRDLGGRGRGKVVLAGDLLGALQAALFGLENEAVLLVEVDPALGFAFVLVLPDGAFEDVIIVFMGGVGRIGRRQSQQCDQFIEE